MLTFIRSSPLAHRFARGVDPLSLIGHQCGSKLIAGDRQIWGRWVCALAHQKGTRASAARFTLVLRPNYLEIDRLMRQPGEPFYALLHSFRVRRMFLDTSQNSSHNQNLKTSPV